MATKYEVTTMQVHDGMSHEVLTLGPAHTLRQAAARMSERGVGAAVIVDPEAPGIGILTERDVLRSVGRGEDPDPSVCDIVRMWTRDGATSHLAGRAAG